MRAACPYTPERNDFVRAWKNLGDNFRLGQNLESVLSSCPEGMAPEQYCICLSVFREAGLLTGKSGSVYGSCYEKQAGKADIKETATYRRLKGTE